MEAENLTLNPIDVVEEVVYQKKWSFSRAADHELVEGPRPRCSKRVYSHLRFLRSFAWKDNA